MSDAETPLCIYCQERAANSDEHIIATWLIDEIEQATGRPVQAGQLERGDGMVVPISVTLNKKGKRQFNFTSDMICADCNSGWMNVIDERARPYMPRMLRGQEVATSGKMRKRLASWAVKTAITARFAHISPNEVEGNWPKQLLTDNTPSQHWTVSLARFIGSKDFFYRQGPLDMRGAIRVSPGDPSSRDFTDGVIMTLVIGQLCVQVIRINAAATPILVEDASDRIRIWPHGAVTTWPPADYLDDSTLHVFAKRFESASMPFLLRKPAEGGTNKGFQAVFAGRVTQEVIGRIGFQRGVMVASRSQLGLPAYVTGMTS